jgi:beta-galactosidase/beta-glucuronidase
MATVAAASGCPVVVPVPHPKPWSPASPFLYDLDLDVVDESGAVLDHVAAYAGLRKVHVENGQVLLNNEPVYLRLVLDQGFYPDGIWTAPNDEALRRDIQLSMDSGFNGARLHQKVFEERFHYWADKMGYLTWGESSSWGIDVKEIHSARNFISEWREIVVRDRSHPSIIAWTPFNETWDTGDRRQHNRLHIDAYELTRSLDPTRPVNDASGYSHARTDLWTVHTYEQSPEKLTKLMDLTEGLPWRNYPDREIDYEGQPYIVDEFGGIKWIPEDRRPFADNSWGYGEGPRTEEEFYTRLAGQLQALYTHGHIAGYCYTQLTDVEQEQNGIYNYDRTEKFDMQRVAKIFKGEK